MSIEDAINIISVNASKYSDRGGPHLFNKRYPTTGSLPIAEDYNVNNAEIFLDINALYKKYEEVADVIGEYFNYRQTEKERLNARIKYLNSICSNLSMMVNTTDPNYRYISDTFSNIDNIDLEATNDNLRAHIATKEGIITLRRIDSINRSSSSKIVEYRGNGTTGNYYVVSADNSLYKYLSESDPHDDINQIIDNNPDTWFEYQMVNVPDNIKPEGEMEWAKGEKNRELLRLKFIIDMEQVQNINWISINPYSPPASNGKLIVYSIKTSKDGFNYQSIYDDTTILNAELNKFTSSYRDEDVITSEYMSNKFAGQGIWSFEPREARYIEVLVDQGDSYDESIGHTIYTYIKMDKDKEIRTKMKLKDVPLEILNSPVGKYTLGANEFIEKEIIPLSGWRYCIGLRDVNIYSYKFAPKSEIVSKTYVLDKPIKEIALIVNEKIPPTFLKDVSKTNTWINYYISINDGHEWHKISPMHRRPMGDEKQASNDINIFPPKVYEINSTVINEIKYDKVYRGYLSSNVPVKTVKLKIEMSRPDEEEAMTPLIEDYTLKMLTEEG